MLYLQQLHHEQLSTPKPSGLTSFRTLSLFERRVDSRYMAEAGPFYTHLAAHDTCQVSKVWKITPITLTSVHFNVQETAWFCHISAISHALKEG